MAAVIGSTVIPVSAYAASDTESAGLQELLISADKDTAASGEDVTLDWVLNEELTAVGGIQARLYFDSDVFELKEYKTGESNAAVEISEPGEDEEGNSFYDLLYLYDFEEGSSSELKAGTILQTTFTVKTIEEEKDADFWLDTEMAFDIDQEDIELVPGPKVSVHIADKADEQERYSVRFDTGIEVVEAPGMQEGLLAGSRITDLGPLTAAEHADTMVFYGWYKDAELTQMWNFDTDIIETDMILYAKWLTKSETEEFTVSRISDRFYNGKAQKPKIEVRDMEEQVLLVEGKDYTVAYKNNVDANVLRDENGNVIFGNQTAVSIDTEGFYAENPYVIVTGKGNYKGRLYINFNILPLRLSEEKIDASDGITLKVQDQIQASDKKVKVLQTLKYGKKALKEGRDYETALYDEKGDFIELKNGQAKLNQTGSYILKITGKGNYTGNLEKTIFADKKEKLLKYAAVKLNIKSVSYQAGGAELTDDQYTVTVKEGKTNRKLTAGTDFEVTYKNNQATGTAKMVLHGKGGYVGTKEVAFQIIGHRLTASDVEISGLENVKIYTGKAIVQNGVKLSLKEENKTLRLRRDYAVSYSKNVNAGVATVIFTGKKEAGYTGSIKKTFKITAVDMNACEKDGIENITVSYTKGGADPSGQVSLRYNGVPLKKGKDYTLGFQNNKVVADASAEDAPTVVITGKGNFTGKIQRTFSVVKKELTSSDISIVVSQTAYSSKRQSAYPYQPKVTIKDHGRTLGKEDYQLVYLKNTQKEYMDWYDNGCSPEEAPQVKITGTGAYDGTVSVQLPIYRIKLTQANMLVIVEPEEYNGKQIEPRVEVYYSADKKRIAAWKKAPDQLQTDLASGKAVKLEENREYTVSYGANLTAGKKKGTVQITGTGQYGGRVTVKFSIESRQISPAE